METSAKALFAAWENFYVIAGSSAATLTGLQFVVMALAADKKVGSEAATRAFATPTIVHFTVVLWLSGLLSAPWQRFTWPVVAVAACGVGGVAYVFRVVRNTRKQKAYRPVFSDIVWHWILPFWSYAVLGATGLLWSDPQRAAFVIAGVMLLLLLIGIRNAWDSATFIANRRGPTPSAESSPGE